jgi:hypothetical protein
MLKVSQSKIKLRRQCAAAYDFKHNQLLRPKVKSRPLQFGSIVHHMLEAHANGGEPFKVLDEINLQNMRLFEAERELYGDIILDIRHIMTDYFRYHKGQDLIYIRRNKRNAEHSFEIEVESGILFTGKIDAFAKKPQSKLKWLVEHKTFKRQPSEDIRWRNVQSGVYIKAVDILGWGHYDGVCWDYIGNKPPTEPELLKAGGMSRRKIVTLPSVVKEFLAKNKLKGENYTEFLKTVEQSQEDYFPRFYTPINRAVVDAVYHDFIATARDIAERPNLRTKTIGMHCGWCDYESICRAEMLGLDVDFVRKREYDVKEKDDYDLIYVAEEE